MYHCYVNTGSCTVQLQAKVLSPFPENNIQESDAVDRDVVFWPVMVHCYVRGGLRVQERSPSSVYVVERIECVKASCVM